MKKNFLWMLAAILLCGTMTTVFTACGDDDDDNGGGSSTANTYEVTLSAVLPSCSAPYMYVELKYTDADGKTQTVTVKEGDQSQTISDDAGIDADYFAEIMSRWNGRDCGVGGVTMK